MSRPIPLRTCEHGGILVAATDFIPSYPAEFCYRFPGVLIGCNNIGCANCGQKVESIIGFDVTERKRFDGQALRTTSDIGQLDWLKCSQYATRLYYCDCGYWVPQGVVGLSPVDPISYERGFDFEWACQSHPLPSAGDLIGGLRLDGLSQNPHWVEQMMAGAIQLTDSPPASSYPGLDLRRLYAVYLGSPEAEALAEQVADCLTHADHGFRRQALEFFYFFPFAPQAAQVVVAARHEAQLFQGIVDPYSSTSTLGEVLTRVLERRTRMVKDQALIELSRQQLLQGSESESLLWSLAEFDWDWIESNYLEILRKSPHQLGYFIFELEHYPPEKVIEILKRIESLGIFPLTELQAECEETWPKDAEKHSEIFTAMGWE